MASVPNLNCANSVAFAWKTIALLVSNKVKSMTPQKVHGNSRTFLSSNFLFFSVKISPVAGSDMPLNRRSQYLVKKKNAIVMTFVKRFMKKAVQKTQEKSPVLLAMIFAVDLPTKPPI